MPDGWWLTHLSVPDGKLRSSPAWQSNQTDSYHGRQRRNLLNRKQNIIVEKVLFFTQATNSLECLLKVSATGANGGGVPEAAYRHYYHTDYLTKYSTHQTFAGVVMLGKRCFCFADVDARRTIAKLLIQALTTHHVDKSKFTREADSYNNEVRIKRSGMGQLRWQKTNIIGTSLPFQAAVMMKYSCPRHGITKTSTENGLEFRAGLFKAGWSGRR